MHHIVVSAFANAMPRETYRMQTFENDCLWVAAVHGINI